MRRLQTVAEAEHIIKSVLVFHGQERLALEAASAGVTHEGLVADRASPPFNRATMDGICVSWEAYQAGQREFAIEGVCSAGAPQIRLVNLRSGACEIMTGAPVPLGADLVIPYEHLQFVSGGSGKKAEVRVTAARTQFENIHLLGSDCGAGTMILQPGHRLNGPRWGIAASFGYTGVQVLAQPRIQIVTTGDEVVPVGQLPQPHQIRGSNGWALLASLRQHGYTKVQVEHVPDDPVRLRRHYEDNVGVHDLLIYTGGVSMGKFDYLPNLWRDLGVQQHFHQVSQRPGKPLWFGTDQVHQTHILGLPGNPVSCLVCLHRYFLTNRTCFAQLAEDVTFKKDLTLFLPVQIEFQANGVLRAQPLKIQNSGEFTALAQSDGFVELPKEKTDFRAGESYRFFPWDKW